MIENSQIMDIVTRIASNYNPQRIILFGSYANGDNTRANAFRIISNPKM